MQTEIMYKLRLQIDLSLSVLENIEKVSKEKLSEAYPHFRSKQVLNR